MEQDEVATDLLSHPIGDDGDREGGETEREEEEEELGGGGMVDDDDEFVSASSSPQVSAPSSPRDGHGVGTLVLPKVSGVGEGHGGGSSEAEQSPRKGPKGKTWQKVKTTWVDASPTNSPDASPDVSPSASPAHADGANKQVGLGGGMRAGGLGGT